MSAIGDLVATFSIDTTGVSSGVTNVVQNVQRMDQATIRSQKTMLDFSSAATGGHRAYRALGHGIEAAGGALAAINPAMGGFIAMSGNAVGVIGMMTHSLHALHKILMATAVAQVALQLLSGPIGWITLAASVVAAAVAFLSFRDRAAEAARKQKELNEEIRRFKIEPTVAPMAQLGISELENLVERNRRLAEGARKALEEQKELLSKAKLASWRSGGDKADRENVELAAKNVREAQEALTKAGGTAAAAGVELSIKRENARIAQEQIELNKRLEEQRSAANRAAEEEAQQQNRVNETMQGLQDRLDEISGAASKADIELRKLGRMPGMDDTRLDAFSKKLRQIADAEQLVQDRQSGKALADQLMTPMERVRAKLADYQRLFDVGAINRQTLSRANAAALKELQIADKGEKPKALVRGTEEAWKAIADSIGAARGEDVDASARLTAENTKRTAEAVEKIASLTEPQEVAIGG